ncbi:unnamed protein product [Effrenium voratum]|nr:unnamed protein product [Effrenium voratum]CAJ1455855.1 unnamed protein product [Effrenium voratum]|mmetsp:Transcript_129010/g.306075  ORF Transcript_129010/g.306075 Transcript_129010/m.306075 type:complete len:102 (+) Transcript_129010:105-410(+)|eukprot:CAMPEP_0181497374 /NCGR_PEP_ID=MMETSP1110-20121109/53500_1 /TAXON_ID=174948 /ORGANISM="Symbiodinium sp., Strain CCMP421" /LENGTH=101 /DNA_ID=CAMNT_0023625307 /DNA_START=102 /DNA_END=407 /DNA_ORIENTATION=-
MGQCNSSSAISVSQDLSPRGAMLCRGSDGAKYVEHEDLQYMEPVQSFRSMDAEQSARAMSGGPPMKATQTRHMERLNRFLKSVEDNNAVLRGEVLSRRLEL